MSRSPRGIDAWRLALLAYPPAYRAERGPEILEVLHATADDRGPWSAIVEGGSLVRHGLAQRLLARRADGRPTATPLGLAGIALALLLGVLGAHALVATGVRGLGIDGYPDAWGLTVRWVDPRWPVHLLWLSTAVALLLGRHRLSVLLAWAAAGLGAWYLLTSVATGWTLPWLGDVGPVWTGTPGPRELVWLLLGVASAVLLGGPGRVARSLAALPLRSTWGVGGAGLAGVLLAQLAATLTVLLLGAGRMPLAEDLRGPGLALVVAGVLLRRELLRLPHGRAALLVLGSLVLLPVVARWSGSLVATATIVAGVVAAFVTVFAAGHAAASRRGSGPSTLA